MAVQRSTSGSIAEDLFIELFSEALRKRLDTFTRSIIFAIFTKTASMRIFFLESNGRRIAIEINETMRAPITRALSHPQILR